MLRFLLALAPLVLLSFLVGQVNHALAPHHVYLFAGGLMVAFAALRLDFDTGLAVVFIAGLFCDAEEPMRFGTHAFLFAAACCPILLVRRRLPREETLITVAVALLANLGIFLVISVALVTRTPAPAATWLRLLSDLLCSQIFVVLVAPWFFALQTRTFALGGIELRGRPRSLI